MKTKFVGIIFVLGLSISSIVHAEMSSTNFIIRADSLSTGGDNASSSSSYFLRDTISGTATGNSSSSSYNLRSGLRPMLFDPVVTLDVAVQEVNVSTSITSLSGTNITVSSADNFSVGNLVVLVQNATSSHVTATGEITAIAGSVITVDQLVSNGSPLIDGTDDILYRATGTSVAFGGLSSSSIIRRVIAWQVSVDVRNGFVVYLAEDDNLHSGANVITDVADGEVTSGSMEYGARSSDTTLASSTFDTQDAAITQTLQQVATVGSGNVSFNTKGYVELKAAQSSGAQQGTYEQNLYLVAAPTY